MRKSYEELNKIKNKYKVDTLWSWSRYHTYKTDTWEYYLKYIKHIKEDRNNSIYCVSGGNVHTIIEDFYNGKIKYEDMINKYEDDLLTMNLAELKYNRNDSEQNEKTANKYENCLRHFFRNHQPITFPHKIEHFILININGIIFQGYCDFLHIEKDKDHKQVVITDWKTSTIYKGKKINEECGQLLLYAEGVRQILKIPLKDITIRWAFLKYVNVQCLQANGKWKERQIERNAIGKSLISNIKMWLRKLKYSDEQIDDYISDVVITNSLEHLPQEVKDKFIINDCYVEIPLSQNKIDSLKKEILDTINEINIKENKYKKIQKLIDALNEEDKEIKQKYQDLQDKIFWQEVTQADSYRLGVLGGYSRKLHKPYNQYLENIEMFENKDKKLNEDDNDLSWLNDI